MSKKFSFNFKFLDRFKKNKIETADEIIENDTEYSIEEENLQEEFDSENIHEIILEENSGEEHADFDPTTDINAVYNQTNEDKTSPSLITNTAQLNPHNPPEEIVNLDDLVKLHREKVESGEDVESYEEHEETDPGQFVELKSSKKIDELLEDAKIKQSFNFLSFKDKFKKFTNSPAQDSATNLKTNPLNRFEWSQLILKIFSPYNRHRVHALFIIGFLGTFTYLLGKNGALVLGLLKNPMAKANLVREADSIDVINTTPEDVTKVTSVNLFNAKNSESEAHKGPTVDIDSIICDSGEKPTDLPLKLMDTVVLQDSVKSVAAVQVRGRNELLNIREGEKLESMAEVSKINRLNVVIKNLETGSCEYIGNNDDETAPSPIKYVSAAKGKALLKSNNPEIKTNGNNFKITKNYRNKMLANINQILTEAKAIQITNPDGTLAYKMTEVVPGSLYSQLNIQENDVITHINGKKIENLNELMSLLGRIKEIDQFQLTLKRNGINENLEYNFE